MRILYQCEGCGTRYPTEAAALACEGQGVAEAPPMGLIVTQRYNYHAGEGAFAGLFVGERPRRLSHAHDWLWHWFRGNNCGDDVEPRSDVLQAPDQWPGRPVRTWRDWSDTEVTEAAAQRAADRARDLGIPPLALKGGQVVPFPVKETHNGKEVGAARTDVA